MHTAELRKISLDAERSLTEARDVLLDVDSPVEELSPLAEKLSQWVTTLERAPELADQRARAVSMLGQARRRRDEHDARNAFRDRYRDFQEREDNALFADSQFTGVGSVANVTQIRRFGFQGTGSLRGRRASGRPVATDAAAGVTHATRA